MNINEVPDAILAGMVRNGCYAKNTEFGAGTRLLVLAVPYDADEAETLPRVIYKPENRSKLGSVAISHRRRRQ